MNILNNISLVGLKMPYGDEFCSYIESLPDGFVLCTDFSDMYRLQKGKRKIAKENLEPCHDMEYLVYSPTSELYYYKIIREYTDMNKLLRYFIDKNIYIRKDNVKPKEEAKPEVSPEDDYVLF